MRRRKLLSVGVCLLAGAFASDAALAQETLPDTHNIPTNAVAGNVTFLDNVRGVSGYSGLNFIEYPELGKDFMFANGTGGVAIWSLEDPEHPALVSKITGAELRLPGDTADRFWEGENLTVDAKRKLLILSRDPRGWGGTVTTGKSGIYIVDVKDPYNPRVITFHEVPAGHTSTCINDCQYVWSVGPYSTGTPGNDPEWMPQPSYSQPWGGVPVWVTNISDPEHPYTYAEPIDTDRFDGKTGYVHSVDVDREGVAWVSGAGGVRGYHTFGQHYDPVEKTYRTATAWDPIPEGGGTTPPTREGNDTFFGFFDHNAIHSTKKHGNYDAGELLFVTNEDITTCSQAGELKILSIKGSQDGQAWRSTPENPYRLPMLSHWTPWGKEGAATSGSCSAHWFTINGNIIAQGWYGQGTWFIDVSDPANPKEVGHFRVPSGTTGVTSGSASGAYWHKGLVYVADYNRGVDVLRFDGEITGEPDSDICWGACEKNGTTYTSETPVTVGGTVSPTLSLTLGGPASFGAFAPGVEQDYTASTTANVVSSAGDATLSVSEPGVLTNGAYSLTSPLEVAFSKSSWDAPVINDAVTIDFKQHIGAGEALRTGSYSKTLTFTLSTTNP